MCWCSVQDSNQGIGPLSAQGEPLNYKKIGIALAIIFSLCALIVLAVGVTGYLQLETLNHLTKMHSITMIVVGSALLLSSITGLVALLCQDTLQVEEGKRSLPKELVYQSKEEWQRGLTLQRTSPELAPWYNLSNPEEKETPNSYNEHSALPALGNYPYKTGITGSAFAVRLPQSQLQGFPQGIQDLFKDSPNVELYFLINYDDEDPSTRRNLVFHPIAFPTYNPDGQPVGYKQECYIQAGLFSPTGIQIQAAGKNILPIDSGLSPFGIMIHKKTEDSLYGTCPNNCVFEIEPEVSTCSFYAAGQFGDRSVAFYSLLIRDARSQERALIVNAMDKEYLSESLEMLSQEDSPCAEDVKKLFAYYP